MSLLDPFKLDGVKYGTAREVVAAKKKRALKGVVENRGVRNRLWNLISSPKQKQQARSEYEAMM